MSAYDPESFEEADSPVEEMASLWVVRCDRSLSSSEEVALDEWLAEHPSHREAFQRLGGTWRVLSAPPSVDEVPPRFVARSSGRWGWIAWGGLAAAAGFALAYLGYDPKEAVVDSQTPIAASESAQRQGGREVPRTVELPDGTVVRLNVGAVLDQHFSTAERRVALLEGEAYFNVAKNPDRPFIVEARGVRVRAVGTAFNVDLRAEKLDVLVTEGKVLVSPPRPESALQALGDETNATRNPTVPLVTAGHRATVPLITTEMGNPKIMVRATTPAEIDEALAWRERLLRLDGVTLGELVQRLEREGNYRIIFEDDGLSQRRLGGQILVTDIEGFIRVLETNLGAKVRREADGTIVLGARP